MHDQTSAPKDLVGAKYIVLGAAMLGLMVGEFIFVTKTGTPWQIAWTYPMAIDVYAYAAFRSGRRGDVATALLLMAASQAGAHLPVAHDHALIAIAPWAVAMPTILWRVHHLSTSNPAAVRAVDVEDAPSAGGAEQEDNAVNPPLPQQRRWTEAEARAAISYHQAMGLKTNAAIAKEMGISPQRVGQVIKVMNRELVAA